MADLDSAESLPAPVAQIERDPSVAPPSSSALSDVPNTDGEKADVQGEAVQNGSSNSETLQPLLQAMQTERQTQQTDANATTAGMSVFDAAPEHFMKDVATSERTSTPPVARGGSVSKRGARGGKRASLTSNGSADVTMVKAEDGFVQTTPSSSGRGRGRGRGGGRPRGKSRGGGRGGKRKREDREDDDDDEGASHSDEVTPIATMTKSGRSVQKPTTFVPPPPPSPTNNKRKRPYRRNPESAVCKTCLRGTSPASNMIVFCDGCNTPYHRYCHHPPIDQAVVDEVEREWYCRSCEKERVVPVPESEIADFVSVQGATVEERKRYFSSLPPGVLATLLTKATVLHPDLPMFAPEFKPRPTPISTASTMPPPPITTPAMPNGHVHSTNPPSFQPAPSQLRFVQSYPRPTDTAAGASRATSTYMPSTYASPSTYTPPSTYAPPPSYVPPPPSSYAPPRLPPNEDHAFETTYGAQHPPNYPRPGHGLMQTLPPEQEDLQWLVDDDDRYGVFTHLYVSDPVAANAGVPADKGRGQISR